MRESGGTIDIHTFESQIIGIPNIVLITTIKLEI